MSLKILAITCSKWKFHNSLITIHPCDPFINKNTIYTSQTYITKKILHIIKWSPRLPIKVMSPSGWYAMWPEKEVQEKVSVVLPRFNRRHICTTSNFTLWCNRLDTCLTHYWHLCKLYCFMMTPYAILGCI